MPIFYDTHAHLDDSSFAADLPQVIERARAVGVTTLISMGTDHESSATAIRIAEQYDNVFGRASQITMKMRWVSHY